MITNDFITLIVAIVAVFIVTVIIKKSKNSGENIRERVTDKIVELDKQTPSTIHFSDDFKSGEPITTTDKNHTITTILMSKEDLFVWVCPICETENPLSKEKCCVCHYKK